MVITNDDNDGDCSVDDDLMIAVSAYWGNARKKKISWGVFPYNDYDICNIHDVDSDDVVSFTTPLAAGSGLVKLTSDDDDDDDDDGDGDDDDDGDDDGNVE